MTFEYIEHAILADKIHSAIKTFIEYHLPDREVNLSDLKSSLGLLDNNERRIQCEFLLTVETHTKQIDDSPEDIRQLKNCIFNAAVYYIINQIEGPYTRSWIPLSTAENSKLRTELSTALGLTKENRPDVKQLLEMYTHLEAFILSHVYKNPGSDPLVFLPTDQQVFSGDFIAKYKVQDDMKELCNLKYALQQTIKKKERVQQIRQVKQSYKIPKETSPVPKVSGLSRLLWSSSTSKKPIDTEDLDSRRLSTSNP